MKPEAKKGHAPAALVRAVKCTKCGAPIELRNVQSLSVVCGSCGSVLDARDPSLAVLATVHRQNKRVPMIPLGSKGRLKGELFQCIGFMTRKTYIEGSDYFWNEYLLFNPYKGYRWLVEYQGHWTSVKPAHLTPEASGSGYLFFGEFYKHFQTCQAQVWYVIGEFYWQVEAGDKATLEDYVCPPNILSLEKAPGETSWSVGTYVEGREVWEAFALAGDPPAPSGIAPAQPSPTGSDGAKVWAHMAAFLLIALLIHGLIDSISLKKRVYMNSFQYSSAETEKSKVTDFFELPGRTSNVIVRTSAAVDNHWLFNAYALINEQTGTAYDFGREVGYYHGVDDGEAWSEGAQVDEVVLSSVPAGKYYLRIEPQTDLPQVTYTVEVRRDEPQFFVFGIVVALLLLPPIVLQFRQHSFEVRRWAESDHPMTEEE